MSDVIEQGLREYILAYCALVLPALFIQRVLKIIIYLIVV